MLDPYRIPGGPRQGDPVQLNARRAATLLLRAARLRCPNCGAGPLFRRWLKMSRTCPGCHLLLDRGEPDYFLGGYAINFVAAELLIVLGAAAGLVLTWPDVPWSLITWTLVVLMIMAPVAFYPFAKTLWLAVDLAIRPLTLDDLEGHGENHPQPANEAPAS